jgi:hypothetical protein
MPRIEIFTNGVRTAVEDWNDTTRQVTVYAGNGTTVTIPARAYTTPENAAADQRVSTTTFSTNKGATQANLVADMALLQTQIAKTNSVLASEFTGNQIGAMLKDIYRTQRRLVRMALNDFATGSD